jgi:hypothetical protein
MVMAIMAMRDFYLDVGRIRHDLVVKAWGKS